MLTRRIWLMVLTVGLFAGAAAVWVLAAEPEFEIKHHDMRGSSQAFTFRVVQLSDLHLHHFGKTEKDVVAQVLALQPDLVVLSGDVIDRADALPVLQSFLQALGGLSVVAVPGNWEHWSGVDFKALATVLADRPAGRFLLNQRQAYLARDRTVHVIGLDDFTAGLPDAQMLTAAGSNDVHILVQHSPGFFDSDEVTRRMRAQPFTLCLSGHTHGGQVTLGGWAPFRPVGSGRFVAGFYDVPGCRLYVSKGLGTSVLPVRWGPKAEVAVFDL
jgi:predicted MPP superfamily phosphohydrolase